jgi:membrane-bound serine protease (ClpP class)
VGKDMEPSHAPAPVARGSAARLRRGWRLAAGIALALLGLGSVAQTVPVAGVAVPAARQADNVAVIPIRGTIDATMAWSVKRRIGLAERAGANAIVFELDTPGGDVGAAFEICDAIKGAAVSNTVAWIHDEAYSAGSIIAIACREIVVSDPLKFGDALAIKVIPGIGLLPVDSAERRKIEAQLLGEVVDSARRNGYDEMFVQGMVTLGVELWLVEHVHDGHRLFIHRGEYRTLFGEDPPSGRPTLASALTPGDAPPAPAVRAPSRSEDRRQFIPASPALEGHDVARPDDPLTVSSLLQEASTRPDISPASRGQYRLIEYVTTGASPILVRAAADMQRFGFASATVRGDAELLAFFGGRNLSRLDATWSEALVRFLLLLPVKAILVVIILVGLFIEMMNPGLGLPGGLAVLALLAFLAPPILIGMSGWWEVAAILGGVALIVAELAIFPGFGLPGIAGLLLLLVGLIGTFAGGQRLFPDSPAERGGLASAIVWVLLALATSGVAIWFISRHLGTLPILGKLVLAEPRPEDFGEDAVLAAMRPDVDDEVPVGRTGRSTTPLRPVGRAEFEGRLLDVESSLGYIPAGALVRVVGRGDLGRYVVEQVSEETDVERRA